MIESAVRRTAWALLLAVPLTSACSPDPEAESPVQTSASLASVITNPSFETNTSGWSSWQGTLTREARTGAPNGQYVARVTVSGAATLYSLDGAQSSIPNAPQGQSYTATAYVAAGNSGTVGKPVSLILREKNASGATYKLFTADATLTTSFQRLTVTGTVERAGDTVDVYVLQNQATSGNTILVDAITLEPAGGGGSSPSGEPMPVGDLTGWRQVFTDDFTTNVPVGQFPAAVSSKWGVYLDGWKDTSKNGTYSPSKVVSIQNGVLNKYLHTENGVHRVAAVLPKIPGANASGGLPAGRYAVRFKADAVPGYKVAWLLWPDSEVWPRDGEIDFPEGDLDGTISGFMHRQNGTSGGDQDAASSSARFTSWHTAIIEWSPGRCRFILDGAVILDKTSRVPSTPMHWVLQTETDLSGTPPGNSAAGNVQIDWVAVWVPK
ncbi:carbohydrate binding domain-containing protein [Corallococcus aberystwythensis]|uniref:Glycosyl hydrolase family protein n=1 Tax=Corallococcus aberystwythensis TaxID=2316722 RepID=A0A3A8R5T4_9BACT|nr:carbohydrate binding domain-containing protein [Corallococcus aberystwythensis]RKH74550.1 glycosyl hydrolase family protein [Corallococcus aberystwythensis]